MKITKFFALMCASAALFTACTPSDDPSNTPPVPEPTGDLVLTASPMQASVGEAITFTAMMGEADVTAETEIFDTANYNMVSNPFIPEVDGEYTFYAVRGAEVSNRVTITVSASVPEIPTDSNASSTDFKHRILIVEHTATGCGYCPEMKNVFRQLHEDETYGDRFNIAEAHYSSLAGNDPAKSTAAQTVGSFYTGVNGFPSSTYNLHGGVVGSRDVYSHKNKIDKLWGYSAQAGIAAAAVETSDAVWVNVEVKAAEEDDYRVACWLLEDNIYGRQSNYGAELGDWINYHNNCIRNISGQRSGGDISGDDLGVIKVGETAQKVVQLPIISQKWVRENLKVLIIVTAPNNNGKYEVVNTQICPLNGSVAYDYN